MAWLVGLAFAYRLLFLLAMPRVLDTADAVHYIEVAKLFAQGDFLHHDPKIPPLFPALGALLGMAISDMEWACRMASFAASCLVVVPLYLLARDAHGRGAARVAGLAVALWPWLADYGCRVSTEATASLWWFLAVWALTRGLRGAWAWLALSLAAFFALHLTRAEGTFIMLAAFPAAFLVCWPQHRARLFRLIPFGVVLLVLLGLNSLYVRQLTGQTTANYRIGFIIQEFDYLRFASTTVKTLSDVLPVMLGPVLLVFLGVGLFRQDEERDVAIERVILFFALAQWALSLFVLSPAPRYLMAPIMVLACFSARGIVLVSCQASGARFGAALRWLPVGALVLSMLLGAAATVGAEHVGRRPREPREYKTAGRWMRENLEAGLVFTRKPQVAYYAGMPSTGPALDDTLDAALTRARNAGARYLVVDERYGVAGLRPLLDARNAPPGLALRKSWADYPDAQIAVYEVLAQP